LARVTGKASAVVLDDFWYRLILAVELGVFCLFFQNFCSAIRCGWPGFVFNEQFAGSVAISL
jgi:hypothetical protein